MNGGLPVGRIAGIPLRLDWSLAVIFWLLTWGLASDAFPALAEGYSEIEYWVAGAVTAAVFLASLLAHETSHSIVARRHGVGVRGITLWLFGGIATLEGEAHDPSAELRIAVAGPACSAAIAVAMMALAVLADGLGGPDLLLATLVWLGSINFMLALFNLAPAAPLDGGRILRAFLWRRHGDRTRATVSAARAGVTFGYVLVALGLLEFAAGAGIGGLWLVFLGWFVMSAARAEATQAELSSALTGMLVRDVMTPDPVTAPADLTVAALLDDYLLRHRCSAFPIVEPDGRISGLVTLARLRQVPPLRRATLTVREVAWPIGEVTTAAPDEPLLALLQRLGEPGDGRALVFDGPRLVGIVSPTDVARAVQWAGLRAPTPPTSPTPPTAPPSPTGTSGARGTA